MTLSIVGFLAGCALWVALDHGSRQLIAAFLLGATVMLAVFGWVLGFDARSLRWQFGAIGERWTADELSKLPPTWHVLHDIENGHGNWDHVAVGPGGVFAIDSKNIVEPAVIDAQGLRAGRLRFGGVATRRSSVQMKERIEKECGESVWVQGVLAVWGQLSADVVERDKVIYVRATKLVDMLTAQPPRLDDAKRELVSSTLDAIARRSR